MFLTEAEAKKKFCPNFIDVNCPGSECMAWRWERKDGMTIGRCLGDGCGRDVSQHELYEEGSPCCAAPIRKEGFCGLARKPEE